MAWRSGRKSFGNRRSLAGRATSSGASRPPRLFSASPRHIGARAAGGGDVRLEYVVHHHPISAEAPAERPDRALHPCNPEMWEAVSVAIVVERHHFVLQHRKQGICVALVV